MGPRARPCSTGPPTGTASSGRARASTRRSCTGMASLRAAGTRTLARAMATARPRPWAGSHR
eukprot:6616824-Pyramimonas_sp.AAC.1